MELWLRCAELLKRVWLFATPWIVARQAPLSMKILQARILECVAMPSSPGSSQPRDRTQVSRTVGRFYCLSHQGSPRILEWVTYPFSRGSSQPRNQTRISCVAGRFFTSWATREAQNYDQIISMPMEVMRKLRIPVPTFALFLPFYGSIQRHVTCIQRHIQMIRI